MIVWAFMRTLKITLPALLIILFLCLNAEAQISQGGMPISNDLLSLSKDANTLIIPRPDVSYSSTGISDKRIEPTLVGPVIPIHISLLEEGTWTDLPGGQRICRLKIKSEGALGMALYYKSFEIGGDATLFIYNPGYSFVIGAYTAVNNPDKGSFATELIPGDELILEYHESGSSSMSEIEISGLLYAYQHVPYTVPGQKDFGSSGFCEVNVNCPEGTNWQREKRGVARILLYTGSSAFWCSGSLINNVRQDSTPYFLTASHCGQNATTADYAKWIFYFNYESPFCENPGTNPSHQSLTGSTLIAKATDATSTGSDFKLLLLNDYLPEDYNPFFNGWSNENEPGNTGVGIHHPKGDIKKISTYTDVLKSTAYGSNAVDPDEKFWRVVWAPTQTNHGVTEGGSSGSPIFNQGGKLIGTLSGGFASCTNLEMPDYYGKFSYSWMSNGTGSQQQLKPWLDPDNTGLKEIEGFGYGFILSASFYTDTTAIVIGDYVHFQDNSVGDPSNWIWHFPGGKPAYAEGQDPGTIKYDSYGYYDVMQIVYKGGLTDTLVRQNYIHVGASIYPVPAIDYINFNFGNREVRHIEVKLYDTWGRLVKEVRNTNGKSKRFKWDISDVPVGMYILRYKVDGQESQVVKIIIA